MGEDIREKLGEEEKKEEESTFWQELVDWLQKKESEKKRKLAEVE